MSQFVEQAIPRAYHAHRFHLYITVHVFSIRSSSSNLFSSHTQPRFSFAYYRTRDFYSQLVKQSILFSYHSHDFAVLFVIFLLTLPFFRSLCYFSFAFAFFRSLCCLFWLFRYLFFCDLFAFKLFLSPFIFRTLI